MQSTSAIKIALIQVAVIISGILAASFGYHAAGGRTGFAPAATAFLAQFGFVLLALPVAWIIVALRLRKNAARLRRIAALGSGIALIVGLTLFSAYAAGKPWIGSARWLQTG